MYTPLYNVEDPNYGSKTTKDYLWVCLAEELNNKGVVCEGKFDYKLHFMQQDFRQRRKVGIQNTDRWTGQVPQEEDPEWWGSQNL